MNMPRRKAMIAGLLIALAVAGVWAFKAHDAAQAGSPAATAKPQEAGDVVRLPSSSTINAMIRLETVNTTALPVTETLSARVAYDEDATARITAGFAGRIARLIASPGDVVKVGSPLAEIDSPDFGLAAADLAKARADEEHKRLTLERSRDLLSGGVIPQKDVESAQADFAQARAETARSAQRVRNLNPAGVTLPNGHFLLASPMAGVVTERNANPAMEVSPALAQPLFVVSDLHRLWVLIDLPERLLGRVAAGAHVAVESDAWPGRAFDATIVHVAQVLDPATRRIAVRARVANDLLELRPEMFVRATVLSASGHGVRVPNESLVNDGLYSYVYLQVGDTAFRRVRVETIIKGAEYSYVIDGLKGGERIVVAGALLLAAEPGHAAGS
jgi:cobalt-zinc-cadmium efflux system membrane fusion protein